jgi:ABC-type uncharacterized transport system substrate-binding protein
METNNNMDKKTKEKFANRTFEPSTSAWERLSAQLDQQPQKKKKGWFFYIGAAASILLLFSIGFQLFSDNTIEDKPMKEIIVINPMDTNVIDTKIDKFINEISDEKVFVKIDEVEETETKSTLKNTNVVVKSPKSYPKESRTIIAKNEEQIIKENVDNNVLENNPSTIKKEALRQNPNSRIKINSIDLLYAVTHNKEDVKAYYARHHLDREDILRTIKRALKKSNIKVNPETILAEVERTIDEDVFQNNFMKSLKNKISDFASVIASRND